MKKYILTGVFVIAFAAYAIWQGASSRTSAVSVPLTTTLPMPTSADNSTVTSGSSGSSTTNTSTASTTPAGKYKSGTYTGSVANAFYGNVQVKAIITNGKLTDVQFLQYPSDSPHSARISQESAPILVSEAVAAQSSKVDVVSGATQMSQAFIQSLASALAQAS